MIAGVRAPKLRKAVALLDEINRLEIKLLRLFPPAPRLKANGHGNGEIKAKKAGPSKARQLAGRYMSVVRGLPEKQKKAVKALRAEKGIRAALSEAKKLRQAAL